MDALPPNYEKATCQHCSGTIEFDANQLDQGETSTVECPHCGEKIVLERSAKSKPFSETASAKWLFVAAASICGGVVVYRFDARTQQIPFTIYLATVLGNAFVPFAVAMLIAVFVRGRAGIAVGLIIVAIVFGLMLLGISIQNKPQRDLARYAAKELADARADARSQFDKTGSFTIDAARGQKMMETIFGFAGQLPSYDSNAVAGIMVVLSPLFDCAEKAQKIGKEITAPEYLKMELRLPLPVIQAKIQRIEEYGLLWERFVGLCRDLEVSFKSELRARGVKPIEAKDISDGLMKGSQMEITIPLVQCNISYAESLARQLSLLTSNYGHWKIVAGTLIFEDNALIQKWDEASREIHGIAEKQHLLQQKLLAQHAPEKQ